MKVNITKLIFQTDNGMISNSYLGNCATRKLSTKIQCEVFLKGVDSSFHMEAYLDEEDVRFIEDKVRKKIVFEINKGQKDST